MDQLNIVLTALGGVVLFLGLVSDYFRRNWWTSDPLTALLLGIALGPVALHWIDPNQWGLAQEHILEQTARLTMAIGLMGVALRLPQNYFWHHWRGLVVLLGIVMPLMWVISGLLVYFILGLPFWQAMMIGAAITPTDPVVATSIVTGAVAEADLPPRLRHIISAESGSNDGLAYPLVLLCVLILVGSADGSALQTSGVLPYWLVHVVLGEIVGAVVLGAITGFVAGQLLKWAERQKTIENTSFIAYSLALSITVLGATRLLGTDGILAVFVAGLVFGNVIGGQQRSQEDNVQEAINRFFTLPIFVLLGTMIPWQQWLALGWKSWLLVVAVLLLRRLPAVLLLYRQIPALQNLPEALFAGWFGPVGVAAIFYAGYCLRRTGIEEVWLVCSLMVFASIVAQGLSATPLTRLYHSYACKQT
ncbi:cation:proton antiporter domain-containing protein [Almyronema epifaneia]|uniref:Cation:proton antiporter n=1 Tax=Almyronema epifaneia S1 TaxID=2991925 RepID=A0ABW6IAB0_9CYAN